jgi:hypothetical protein
MKGLSKPFFHVYLCVKCLHFTVVNKVRAVHKHYRVPLELVITLNPLHLLKEHLICQRLQQLHADLRIPKPRIQKQPPLPRVDHSDNSTSNTRLAQEISNHVPSLQHAQVSLDGMGH